MPARAVRDNGMHGAIRPLAAAAVTVVVVALAGGGGAFWLSVPVALLVAAPAGAAIDAALAAALPPLAALTLELLAGGLGPPPPVPVAIVVVAASVSIMRVARLRADREREALRASAFTDPLTGIANRRALDERVAYEVARHSRGRRPFALLMLDLDGFKGVNDRFGHPAGDDLLREVADALSAAVREQDTVARVGGDEFCVLAPETDHAGAGRLAARVTAAVEAGAAGLDGVSASVGFALFPVDGTDGDSVRAAADAAQADAKRRLYAAGERTRRVA